MNKILLSVVGAALILVVGFFILNNYIYVQKQGEAVEQAGYKDIPYIIEGQSVSLTNGRAESSGVVTNYFGNEAEGDLNEDGVSDIAFLVTQQTGGSGTFYYVVAALKTNEGYVSAGSSFLGDRIAPQTTEISAGRVVVNYAQRKTDEPMTAEPSVGVTQYFAVVGGMLSKVQE